MQKQNGGIAARSGKIFRAVQKTAHGLAAGRNFAKKFVVHIFKNRKQFNAFDSIQFIPFHSVRATR
jgi:hypothetical protein